MPPSLNFSGLISSWSRLREQGSEVVAIVRREDAMNELNAIDGARR
jgi:hypothetical protein